MKNTGGRVKKRELEKKLSALGWYFSPEINENLAKKILKTAKNNPPKEK